MDVVRCMFGPLRRLLGHLLGTTEVAFQDDDGRFQQPDRVRVLLLLRDLQVLLAPLDLPQPAVLFPLTPCLLAWVSEGTPFVSEDVVRAVTSTARPLSLPDPNSRISFTFFR